MANSNKLVLNINKTHYMIFFSNKSIDYNDIVVSLNGNIIDRCSSLKILGVTIDSKLSFNEHVEVICTKISVSIHVGILNKLKHFPQNILKMIYNSIISPYFQYCNLAWNSSATYMYSMLRLYRLQKRAVRLISHANFLAHTKPLFNNLNMLNIFDFSDYEIAYFMYLCFKNYIPNSISEFFCYNADIHSYNTHGTSNFHLPKIRTSLAKNCIFFKGPKIWNSYILKLVHH